MVEEEKPRRNWPFIGGITLLLAMVVGSLVYMIVPPLLTFERLELWSFVGWTANSKGEVKQATFIFINNGTRRLTINNFWINGTLLNSTERLADGGLTLDPRGSEASYTARVCLVPRSFVFNEGMSYNFTVGTTSGNRYSFVVKCNEASVKPENLTITDFLFIPGSYPYDPPLIAVLYKNNGHRPVVIRKMYLDGMVHNVTSWVLPSREDYIMIDYGWRPGETYTIRLVTVIGNTYSITKTAE